MSCFGCCGDEDTQRAPDNRNQYPGSYPASNSFEILRYKLTHSHISLHVTSVVICNSFDSTYLMGYN
jgi:hypothetical protein